MGSGRRANGALAGSSADAPAGRGQRGLESSRPSPGRRVHRRHLMGPQPGQRRAASRRRGNRGRRHRSRQRALRTCPADGAVRSQAAPIGLVLGSARRRGCASAAAERGRPFAQPPPRRRLPAGVHVLPRRRGVPLPGSDAAGRGRAAGSAGPAGGRHADRAPGTARRDRLRPRHRRAGRLGRRPVPGRRARSVRAQLGDRLSAPIRADDPRRHRGPGHRGRAAGRGLGRGRRARPPELRPLPRAPGRY